MKEITEKEILDKQTEKGGWTKKTLAEWGVPWPPPKGWKEALLKNGLPYADSAELKSPLVEGGA